MKLIKARFCLACSEIIYSRSNHDVVFCSCGHIGIDDKGHRRVGGIRGENSINIQLNGDVLLEQILEYDWNYKNRNADKYEDGYYGRFKITNKSNSEFYDRLIMSDNKHQILELMDNYDPPKEVKAKMFDIEIPDGEDLNNWYYVTCKKDVHKVLDDRYVLPSGAVFDLEYPQWITLEVDGVGFRKKDNRAYIYTKEQVQYELNKVWEGLDE